MSLLISDRDIARVRQHNPIAAVAREHVDLSPADDGTLKGACPFAADTTETFYVTPERGMWFCFGCDAGGDVITLIEKIDGISYIDAAIQLADRAHLELDLVPDPAAVRAARALRDGIPEAIEQRDLDALIHNLAGWLSTDTTVRRAANAGEEGAA
ncbi:CHC2 zinc finger domain-containing protein [Nonomuraea indica]|uniref:CHC2 zinc finger domain-containing protein n=1 Tax=Nonomuraea indica TaxID=1581193 RepID=UPI000C7E26AD|nr:CHC2 zinc finger domain-containing protein [Nonomuraea indica]